MSAVDDRVWLQHPGTGGYFHCPAGAVADWTSPELGWQVADAPPAEGPNPVVAERVAAEAEQRAAAAAASNEAPAEPGAESKE